MKLVILDRSTIDPSIDFSAIRQQVSVYQEYSLTTPEEVHQRISDADIVLTNKVVIDDAAMNTASQLKLIAITATGTNNVDLVSARQHNIVVTNVAGYSVSSVSQHIFAWLLNIVNQVDSYQENNLKKPWSKSPTFCQLSAPVNELSGKTLGILGYGDIGKNVASLGKAFGMKVIIAERADATTVRAERVCFEQLLKQSDVISLHCPLTESTQGLFDKAAFDKMKPGCIFINTARGPIVNSQDLAHALKSRIISHAIIDVLETEPPPPNHPLLQTELPGLTLTHHIAWGSLQAQQRLVDGVSDNIAAFLKGNLLNRV